MQHEALYITCVCMCIGELVHNAEGFCNPWIFLSVSHWLSRQDVLLMRSKQKNTRAHMERICVPDTAFLQNAVVLTHN